uniref:protein-serine/threonine phosphatase n=1 Tax=Strigamia maritima TaxID=126957 RepID=T1JKV7_STRMM
MGAYLSEPVTEKMSVDERNDRVDVGASSMQGWRVSQEDSHSCELDFDADVSLFAVYDGHGGPEVAQYCSAHLPACIKSMESYKKGNMAQALEDAFLSVDKSLITPSVLEELKRMADEMGRHYDGDGEDEDEVLNLHVEANMPMDQVLAKYRSNYLTPPKGSLITRESRGRFLRPSEQESEPESEPGTSKDSSAVATERGDGDDDVANGAEKEKEKEKKRKEEDAAGVTNGEISGKKLVSRICSKILSPILQREARRVSRDGLVRESEDEESEESDDDDFDQPESSSSNSDNEDEGNEDEDEEDEDEDEEEEEEEEFVIGEKEEPGFDSGCTAVVALLRNDELFVANAGDSRCVVCRNGKAIEMSRDHKPEDDLERNRIENAGGSVTLDGRVNGGLNLSRAIGDHSYKKNEKLDAKEQMISALPDIRTLTIDSQQDEFMVVACDGIWNFMSSQSVIDFVRERLVADREKLSTICEELFDKCLSPTTIGDGTGCDNMTCIVVKFKQLSDAKTCKRHSDTEVEQENKRIKTKDEKE